jgi:hypothetical protein
MIRVAIGLLLVGGLAIVDSTHADGQDSPAVAEEAIRKLEAAEAKAMLAADIAALETFWGEAFTVNAPDNQVWDRKNVVVAVRSGFIKYTRFERTVEYVGFHADTAVVMGKEVVKPSGGPEDGKTLDRRYTNVWAKKDGRWVMVARHAHVVPAK